MTQNGHITGERLISYLYDECDAAERAIVGTHLSACAACAAELAGLGATREHLSAWAPPDVALGFQITRPAVTPAAVAPAAESQPAATARVLRPARWHVPVWAQAAAATIIFSAGLSIGMAGGWGRASAAPPDLSQVRSEAAAANQALVAEVQRLRDEVTAMKKAAPAAVPAGTPVTDAQARDAALLARVKTLIEDSEAEMRTDMTLRLTQLGREFEQVRRQDVANFNRNLDVMNNQVGQAYRQLDGLSKVVGMSVAPGR